jgi:hypothetical protein
VTLHSAANVPFEGRAATTKNISEEEKLRWKNMTMLIIDEISQVGGLTLAAVDSRLRRYRDDQCSSRHSKEFLQARPHHGCPFYLSSLPRQ